MAYTKLSDLDLGDLARNATIAKTRIDLGVGQQADQEAIITYLRRQHERGFLSSSAYLHQVNFYGQGLSLRHQAYPLFVIEEDVL